MRNGNVNFDQNVQLKEEWKVYFSCYLIKNEESDMQVEGKKKKKMLNRVKMKYFLLCPYFFLFLQVM